MMKQTFKKGFILLALPILMVGCSEQTKTLDTKSMSSDVVNESINKESDIRTVSGVSELVNEYETVGELVNNSQIIANVKVQDQKTIVHEGVPFTISNVKVNKIYKGNDVEKNIQIIETGGVYEPEGKPGQNLDKVLMQLNGVSTLEDNQKAVLFLQKFEGPQTSGAFIALGAYQGKFKINKNNEVISAVTEEKIEKKEEKTNEKEEINKQLENFTKINTLEELEKEIQNSL